MNLQRRQLIALMKWRASDLRLADLRRQLAEVKAMVGLWEDVEAQIGATGPAVLADPGDSVANESHRRLRLIALDRRLRDSDAAG